MKPTGKVDVSKQALKVWQDYVAGTDPTDVDDCFTASITMNGDTPVITVKPELSDTEKAKRKYTLYGRTSLFSGDWSEIVASEAKNYNFFKVRVEMK